MKPSAASEHRSRRTPKVDPSLSQTAAKANQKAQETTTGVPVVEALNVTEAAHKGEKETTQVTAPPAEKAKADAPAALNAVAAPKQDGEKPAAKESSVSGRR